MHRSAVCLFVKNEVDDIAEWVAHYIGIGADALLIYDDSSGDGTLEILSQLAAHFPIRVFNWETTEKARQHAAYRDCLKQFSVDFEWIGFVDIDEFLIPPPGASLHDLFDRHENHDAIAINWLIFGTSGVKEAKGRLVMETFTRRASTQFDTNRHVKSFVRPKQVKKIMNAHYFDGPTKYADVLGRSIIWADPPGIVRAGRVVLGDWQLNHYVLRSEAHWRRRLARGTGNGTENPTNEFFIQHDRNEVLDDTALPYAARARVALLDKGFHIEPQGGASSYADRYNIAPQSLDPGDVSNGPRRFVRGLSRLDEITTATRYNLNSYNEWAWNYLDTLRRRTDAERKEISADYVACNRDEIDVSIILPALDPNISDLVATVESIIAQTYVDWELIVVVGDSRSSALSLQIDAYSGRDERIKVVSHDECESNATLANLALETARGKWIILSEPSDVFVDVALEAMVSQARSSRALLLYSDGDRVDRIGRFSDPLLKPDWNYRMMLSVNYIGHIFMVDRETLNKVGNFSTKYDGAQDHDILLRLSEFISHDKIRHVSEILYHKRFDSTGAREKGSAGPDTVDAGRRAIHDHLQRQGMPAEVKSVADRTWYQVCWPFIAEPNVCIIIPFRDNIDITRECVERVIGKTDYRNYEIILVDNWSVSDEAREFCEAVERNSRVRVMRVEEPFNYSRLNNIAACATDASYLILMNNDLHVRDAGWLRALVNEALADRDVGIVGGKFLYPDGSVQHAGVVTGIGGVACHINGGIQEHEAGYMGRALFAQELSVVTAACLLIDKKLYWQVGGLDEERLKVAFNDVDLCLKVREQGRKVIWIPTFVATHYESASRGTDFEPEKALRFHGEVVYMQQRWGTVLRDDPHYSRFFDLESATAFHDLIDPSQLSDRLMPLPLRYPKRWIHG